MNDDEQPKVATYAATAGHFQIMPSEANLVKRLRALPEDGVFLVVMTKVRGKIINLAIVEAKREAL